MKSSKQKRAELKVARKAKAEKRSQGFADGAPSKARRVPPPGEIHCNPAALAATGSYDTPEFVRRGTYRDLPFTCVDCGKLEIWAATQQKWWYETAKGDVWTTATRCRPCRQKERMRKNETRRVHLEGLAAKAAKRPT